MKAVLAVGTPIMTGFLEWKDIGKPEDKYVDLIPNIEIGRLPCRYRYEVKIMVDKKINYEKTLVLKTGSTICF
ncbi:MAG: C25 family cysteine peptidase [Candidatus Thermoplasmatota archaeon]